MEVLIYLHLIDDVEKNKFEQLYHRYKGLMYHIASKMLSNQQDREDAMQMAFEALARNIGKIQKIDCPQTFTYVVATIESKSIDIQRDHKKRGESDYDERFDENVAGIDISLPGDNGLADALARLPARYREILLLRFEFGYSTKEISKMMDIDRGTVQKLIWRAREALRRALEERH